MAATLGAEEFHKGDGVGECTGATAGDNDGP